MKTITPEIAQELKRCVEDPSLLSDNGSLRMHLAHLLGISVNQYPRGHEPWNMRLVPRSEVKP